MKNLMHLKLTLCTLSLMLFTTCSDDDTIQYRLTTQVTPAETGTLTPVSGLYNQGTEIELKATPNEEYIFTNWTGDASGNVNPLTIIMLDDKNITAVFEKVNYSLTLDIIGEGTVNQEIVLAKSTSKDYESGTTVQLTAVPDDGWEFVEWSGDHTGTENPIQLTMDKAMSITAKFEKVSYALTIEIEGNGTVNEEIVQAKSSTDYPNGTSVQLTAVPDENWQFTGWSKDYEGTENPIQIIIEKPMTIKAVFEEMSLEKTYVPDDNFEKALIDLGYDDQMDDYVYTQRIRNIEGLTIENKEIEDLTGIEDFENLTTLFLTNNNLQSLDISENTKLQILICSQNQLTSLDISQNISLYYMVIVDNLLTCIQATESQITSRLFQGAFAPSYMTDEDVIFSLDCDALNDAITFVPNDNFEKALIELGYDDILDDYVKTIIIAGILELDLSNRNITDLTGIEDFTMLENLNCRNNELTQLDISKNYSLTFGTLDISNNNITCVQISLGQSQVSGLGVILDWTNDDGTDYSLDCGY